LDIARFIVIFFCILFKAANAQNDSLPLSVIFQSINEKCTKGEASVNITGGKWPYTINWSNGKSNVASIKDLSEGEFTVTVGDLSGQDTTINFSIKKEKCPVVFNNHFTPNGDNYNDTWQVGNIQNYPEFELFVHNKWGQQVHYQKNNFVPWDGTWNGVQVPDGTYYFVFYFKGSDKDNFLKGDVSILR
jgi:gliding motility-associated-like protein